MVKKGDILLSVGCVLVAVFMLACVFFFKADGKKAVVTIDGEIFGEYLMSENQEINISTDLGQNKIQIKDGKVSVISADCPDKYCVEHVAVDSVGETVVCLPHRVVVEIKE